MNLSTPYRISLKSLLVVLICFVLAGCFRYQYNNKSYSTPEEVIAAQAKDYDEELTRIEPASERIGGSALIVLPDRRRITESGFKTGFLVSEAVRKKWVEFGVEVYDALLEHHVNSIKKRNLFDEVAVQRVYDMNTPQALSDYIIWYNLQNSERSDYWYFLAKGTAKRKVIHRDKRLPENEWMNSWLNSLYELAKKNKSP